MCDSIYPHIRHIIAGYTSTNKNRLQQQYLVFCSRQQCDNAHGSVPEMLHQECTCLKTRCTSSGQDPPSNCIVTLIVPALQPRPCNASLLDPVLDLMVLSSTIPVLRSTSHPPITPLIPPVRLALHLAFPMMVVFLWEYTTSQRQH